METILDMLARGWDQLLGRAGGPLHFRLVMMPTVVTVLAIRRGLREARERQPAFLWAYLTNPAERPQLLRSAFKDIGRVFLMAVILDTTYQLAVLHWFYPVQLAIVAVACAVVPYIVVRGPVTRLARWFFNRQERGQPS